jgi:hypothetical protein
MAVDHIALVTHDEKRNAGAILTAALAADLENEPLWLIDLLALKGQVALEYGGELSLVWASDFPKSCISCRSLRLGLFSNLVSQRFLSSDLLEQGDYIAFNAPVFGERDESLDRHLSKKDSVVAWQ